MIESSEVEDLRFACEQSYEDRQAFVYSKNDVKHLKNDQLLWNILPSYEYLNNQFIKLNEPPTYQDELSGASLPPSLVSGSSSASTISAGAYRHQESQITPEAITFDDAGSNPWQATVLDNVGYLNNMTYSGNLFTENLKINTYFIKEVAEFNQPVELIDSHTDYKQGDTINGYVTIENTTQDTPIKFKMFYLLFEGIVKFKSKTIKFLEMFDMAASSHGVHVNRLITEYQWNEKCPLRIDSEGYHHTMPSHVVKPKTKYKRFFSFKIPNQLLDNQTEHHNCVTHLNIPPEIGKFKDFGVMHSFIKYQVTSVFIGKAMNYDFNPEKKNALVFNHCGEEYVILKSENVPISIVPKVYYDPEVMVYQNLYYKHFDKKVNQTLQIMSKVSKVINHTNKSNRYNHTVNQLIQSITDQINLGDNNKVDQLFVSTNQEKFINSGSSKDIVINLTTQSLLKSISLQLVTPHNMYRMKYISPNSNETPDILNIPITIICKSSLQLKYFQAELCVLTIGSEQQIPLEFTHDIIFKNNNAQSAPIHDRDTFKQNVIEYYKRKLNEFRKLLKVINTDNIKVEKNLIQDIECLSLLSEKTINLLIKTPQLIQNQQVVKQPQWINGKTQFSLKLDMANLCVRGSSSLKPFTDFTLLPSFQSSNIARMYYLRVWLQFNHSQVLFKVPVCIEHQPSL